MVMLQAPRADKVTKFVLKVAQEDLGNTSKNHIDCNCRFFTIFFTISPPQMLLTINLSDNGTVVI